MDETPKASVIKVKRYISVEVRCPNTECGYVLTRDYDISAEGSTQEEECGQCPQRFEVDIPKKKKRKAKRSAKDGKFKSEEYAGMNPVEVYEDKF